MVKNGNEKNKAMLFYGGDIITVTEVKNAEAVFVEGDKIQCIGTLEKCKHYAEKTWGGMYEEYDLCGKTMLPGFIDIHSHLMMLGMGYRWVDVSYPKVKSIEDMIFVLKEAIDDLPPGEIIRGFGYNHRLLAEKRHPNAGDLDRVSKDRPVQIMHHSGHSNVVNHFFLKQSGIEDGTPDPKGGTIDRDKEGIPTGILFDSAADYLTGPDGVKILNHGPNIHMTENMNVLQNIIRVGQDCFLKNGVTTANDIQVTKQEMESYLTARNSGLLKIRTGLSFISSYLEDIMKMGFNSTVFGEGQLFFGPLKLYSDGALNSGTAAMSVQYGDGVKNSGFLYHDQEEMKEIIMKAHKYGLQCACHGQGDLAIENIILAYEAAQEAFPREDCRHRIEHFGMPTEKQVERMGKLNAYGVPQPHWLYEKGDTYVTTYGEERASNFCPYAWYKKYGLPLIISSDAPVAVPDPMNGIYAAVTRKTVNGTSIGSQHKISVMEAIEAYTINPAKGIFMEDKLGSLAVGKYADFAILDRNPLKIDVDQIVDIEIMETWIGGMRVFEK